MRTCSCLVYNGLEQFEGLKPRSYRSMFTYRRTVI